MVNPTVEPRGTELDAALVAAEQDAPAQALHALAAQVQPRPAFADQLEARLRRATQPALQPQRGHGRRFGWGLPPLAVGGSVAGLLLLVGSLAWFNRPAAVSAADILAQAAQSKRAIQGYHGTLVEKARGTLLGPFIETHQEHWFQAPDSYRNETHLSQDGREVTTWWVTDGTTNWQYQAEQQEVMLLDPAMIGSGVNPAAFGATDLQSLLRGAGQSYDARLVGNEQIAGHPAYVIEMLPKPGGSAPDYAAHIKLWVDQQYYFVIGSQSWDAQGNLLDTETYTNIEYNPILDPHLFKLNPPPGVHILDARPGSAADLDTLWHDVARQAAYPVFIPTYYPPKVAPGRPLYDAQRGVITQPYRPPNKNEIWIMLLISEGPPAALPLPAGGTPVQVGAYSARIWNDGTLALDRDGTRILLKANYTSQPDDLIRIVQSMQPVAPK